MTTRPGPTSLMAPAFACLAAVLVAAGCARQGEMDTRPDSAAPDTLEGTVRRVGNTPFVRTVVRGGDTSATVVGDLAEELGNASGARVRVWGAYRDGERPGPELEVAGYDIVSVDGVEPTVGILHHDADRGHYVTTGEGDEVALSGVPDGLADRVGAKIWVVLSDAGSVQRYGVLREP